ncbi:AAA family ATPase [Cellulomonas sp. DKR-3]|uniref:AAA family ATPase n=1 Tax=Cellulomonas fulva TaxID=2835530 RepID=A0ABS5U2P0_9CELL|nr:LuxR family transcriptional regulator [Cellulomonas fulva]MBT0995657.1 AAA family ATPase [Cellulomonas fulva]
MSTPFVARSHQVDVLRDALVRAGAGAPGVVLVAGDAGVGKSALVREVARRAADGGAAVVVAHCVDLGEIGLPYLPFAEAVARLREECPETVARVAADRPALGRLLGRGDLGDDADRLQLFDALAELFAAVASADRPLLLVVEDAHWADASSRDVLRFLVSRLHDEHVLLVVSYRTDDLHRRHPWRPVALELARHPRVQRLELPPFTPAEVREFATALTGRAPAARTVRRVAERSGGNAYFAQELLEQPDDELPGSLADVLRARVEQLDPAVQQLVRVASVAGRRVDEPLLRAAAGALDAGLTAGFDAALREAVGHHVLAVEDGHLAFRHALLAEAVAADLLPGETTAVHRAYVTALRAEPALGSAAELATHAMQAHDLPTALGASLAAGRAAHTLLAPEEELRHLEVALRLWDAVPAAPEESGERRDAVLARAASAAAATARRDRAVQLARSAVEEATDADRPRRRTALARHLQAVERVADALEQSGLALADLPTAPSAERAWALATHARSLVYLDRTLEAFATTQEALAVARGIGALDAESDALTTLAVMVADDDADQAEQMLHQALERARSVGDVVTQLRILTNMAANRYDVGDLEGTGRLAADGVGLAAAAGLANTEHGLELAGYAALVAYQRGDLSPVPAPARGPDEDGGLLDVAVFYSAAARGDEDLLDRARALEPQWERDGLIALVTGGCAADVLTRQGATDEAVALVSRVVTLLSEAWNPQFFGGLWLSALALAALADAAEDDRLHGRDPAPRVEQGEPFRERVESTAARPLPPGRRVGPEGLAWVARARAEHARLRGAHDEAVELWRASVEAFGYGNRYEQTRSRSRWAQALLEAGDRTEAARQATTALQDARAMAAVPLAEELEALARRGRLAVPGTASERAGADVLTARESEVLALVAQGLSNNQIGARLFISGKTVSVHISNVLAKLGASGRAEAVSIAHRRGLLDVAAAPG